MAGFDRSVVIERPLAEVWDFFVDDTNAKRWMPDVENLVKITDGPVGLGTRYHETRVMKGKPHTATMEITAFDERKLYAGTVEEMGVRGTYTYAFSETGGGTRIDLVAEATAKGMAKLMLPLVIGMMTQQDGEQLERLKAAVESAG